MGDFVHLHLHTQYSLLDGANKITHILEKAKRDGHQAIAITDHGNMHGAVEFYLEAKRLGIKPIIGCELYVTPGSRHERKTRSQGGSGTHHLTVLASDLTGYRNLCKLVSFAYKEGFYFKPRVDHELLEKYNEGIIALSGCLAGEFASFVEQEDLRKCKQVAEFYSSVFKDRFYLEVQPHQIAEQRKLNEACADVAKSLGIPIVATTDCHYPNEDDHYAQEVLMCVATGKTITDPDRIRHEGVKLYLKNFNEMRSEFGDSKYKDEALKATAEIANRCNLSFDFNTYYMPQFKSEKNEDLKGMMAILARDGLVKRLEVITSRSPEWSASKKKMYEDRLEEEIQLIDRMGFSGYFLVVADFIVWAKEHGIPVGPGRGSVAGSLVAYAMRITEIDPIENKCLFERFLNPERVSLPDIDVDFCIHGRDRVIQYVVEKYGKENVAQICTFGTLKAKAAIKDVGRALGKSFAEMDKVAELIPAPRQGFDFSLEESIKMEKRLADYAANEGKELITLALKLEGLTRHTSTHAAGVVIGDRPLVDLLPMMVDKDGNDVTQYSMKYVEKIGLVKFDFLGLKTLTVIHTALEIIRKSRSIEIDLERLPLDDPKTYAMLCSGNTTGVFQLESSGMTEMTMRLKPNCFDDIVAILSLFRPGPLDAGMVDRYIERKHGREPVTYAHPLMKRILADTYGIIVYQEQIMQLARELAGYSLGQADLLRRAMGKKNPEEMAKQRDMFIFGAIKKGIEKKLADSIFDQMETFARYGFNRSHSAAYAMISYQTAYLKSHYGVEFMAALMSNEMDDSDKTLKNLNECRKQKIEVLPPDVNLSDSGFTVEGRKIRFGLSAVKGIGEKAVFAIKETRQQTGPFSSLDDFFGRIDLHAINRKVVEGLTKCGAFDSFKVSRREMLERLEESLKFAQAAQRTEDKNQISLFGDLPTVKPTPKKTEPLPEWPINQRLAFEREALGFYISGHPLSKHKKALEKLGVITTAEVASRSKSPTVRVGGVVTGLKLKNTKKGDRYATFSLEDWIGTVETIVWPDVYRQVAHLIVADDPVVITGRPDVTNERCNVIAEKIESLLAVRDKTATHGLLNLKMEDHLESRMKKLLDIFGRHIGNCPIKVLIDVDGSEVSMLLKDQREAPVRVMPSENLSDEIEQVFGRPVLSFVA